MNERKPTYEELERLLAESQTRIEYLQAEVEKSEKIVASLREGELLVQPINNNLINGMIYQVLRLKDGSRKFTYLSERVREYYGISPLEGMADASLIYGKVHEDDRERVIQEEEKANETMRAFSTEARMFNHRGEMRWSHFVSSPRRIEDGVTCWDGFEYDITERKKAEEALWESEQKYRAIVDNALIGLGISKGDRIVFVNKALLDIYGYDSFEEMASKSIPEHLTPESRETIIEYRGKRERGEPAPGVLENDIVRKDGRIRTLQLMPKYVVIGGEKFTQTTFVDVTERKRAEEELKNYRDHLEKLVEERTESLKSMHEQLLHSQKMEAIGQLAGGIAHDFNNIIATISGAAEMLVRSTPADAPIVGKLERILNAGRRAKDLTMKLLTFARKEKLNVKTISPLDIVADVIDMLKSTLPLKIRVSTEYDGAPGKITVDSTQIFQAILNMSLNACDAMPQGGDLTIKMSSALVDDFTASERGVRSGEYVVITIQDTGTGIGEENIDKLFEPFFTTKDRGKGSGLGLSVSHGIIKAHGGFIKVKTEKGRGAAFSIFLPAADSGAAAADGEEESRAERTAHGNILVIDDDQDFAQTMKEALDGEGFSVDTALSGRAAIEYYRNKMDETDLVLLDMLLPEMNGVEIFDALREMNPTAKIVLCSGYSIEGDATALLEKGAMGFIQKPFEILEVVDIISGLLHGKALPD